MKTLLVGLLLLLIRDDVKTVKRQVTLPQEIPTKLDRKISPEKVMKKWGIEAWWAREKERSGIQILIMAPEVIAAFVNQNAVEKQRTDEEAQSDYTELMLKSAGSISFVGLIQLYQGTYSNAKDSINSEWTFYLYTPEGKRHKPLKAIVEPTTTHQLSSDDNNPTFRRRFILNFPLTDPDTKKPILDKDTEYLEIGLSSIAGQVKARFVFKKQR